MDLGFAYIDFAAVVDFFTTQSTSGIVFGVFFMGGWLMLVYLLLYAGIHLLAEYKEHKLTHHWEWVVLAIDVPLLNVQTPKAVEQMFAHLAGAYGHVNIAKKYRHGFKQPWFSFEVISLGGYIQFLMRTEVTYRDLIEAAFYAQYPDSTVTEVEDYVNDVPHHFPNQTHDMWAADFTLTENYAYPIRTYREFEHNISKDTVLKDPMGAFLESFTRIGPGEQLWFQIIVEPAGNHWKEHAMEEIKKIIGDESSHGHGGSPILDAVSNAPMKILEGIGDQVFAREASHDAGHEEHAGPPNQIQYLTPGQKTLVEAMELKIAKIGFKTKLRVIYIAKKEVFKPGRVVSSIIGAINQYNIPTANSLAPTYDTHTHYFFSEYRNTYRKNLLMRAYSKRKAKSGASPYIFNIEELATIWHFPMSHVKTPSVQKTQGKQAEPPAGLPVEEFGAPILPRGEESEYISDEEVDGEKKSSVYRTDAGDSNTAG